MRTPSLLICTGALTLVVAWGCNSVDDRMGFEGSRASTEFGEGDAGAEASVDPDASFGVLYCPSSECALGYTTCPDSRFLCDTNLLSDPLNCGACGRACPRDGDSYFYRCLDGACVMQCKYRLDCDGIVDNGCESPANTNDHCGACNVTCDTSTDPARACTDNIINGVRIVQCGCPYGLMFCGFGYCVSKNSDKNCGACGNECDPDGGPQPTPPNAYYGCEDEQCGRLKCKDLYLNCDGDPVNGCEVMAVSDDHCGKCGHRCESGTRCILNDRGEPECSCPPGTSICVIRNDERGFDEGYCADLGTDNENCGGCGVECLIGSPFAPPLPGAQEACVHGSCQLRCLDGYADCNATHSDGCEINVFSDPSNCGGCGLECDRAAGQACVGGRCMVKPCEIEDEETAR